MIDQLQLPIHEWLLENVSDALIFENKEGYVVAGNQKALELLQIRLQDKRVKVIDYINFEAVVKKTDHDNLVWTKTIPEKLIIMNRRQIGNLNCYIIREGGLKEKKDSLIYTLNHARNGPFEGIIMHDRGQIIDCDYAFCSMLGYKRADLVGKSIFDLVHQDDHNILSTNMTEGQHDSPYPLRGYKSDGSVIYAEVLPEPVQEEDYGLRIAIVRNITERVENEKQIEFMAYYDQLTDLPNRNYFQIVVEDELNNAKQNEEYLAVHFIDIDYFKHINDTLGYQVGDSLLRSCASRLKQLLYEDLFIARMTSDEFLVLQRNVKSEEDVKALAKKIIDLFRNPVKIDGYEIYTTVSVGISLYPESATTTSQLIEHADSAMHVIKEESRNDFQLFKHSLKKGFKERLRLETELHKAIKEDNFELHFQPQYDLQSNEITGFEALCRWNHEEMGYIPPDRFIPLAEKTGLILEIGDWVIYEACRQNKLWQNEGLEKVKVSVNLSAKQFLQRNLVERVSEILEETGLESKYLELEITESIAMSNERYIIDTLKEFRELGVQVALDDFGTGYSSLKYLSQFPLSKIKIDRTFIQNQNKQNIAIVKTIIHLSHALNLKVIAEGVENEKDLTFLVNERCDEVQGFYFSKPLPANEVLGFVNV
ncbi:EAL domain-containing protein [Alkalibacillus silvisoli]